MLRSFFSGETHAHFCICSQNVCVPKTEKKLVMEIIWGGRGNYISVFLWANANILQANAEVLWANANILQKNATFLGGMQQCYESTWKMCEQTQRFFGEHNTFLSENKSFVSKCKDLKVKILKHKTSAIEQMQTCFVWTQKVCKQVKHFSGECKSFERKWQKALKYNVSSHPIFLSPCPFKDSKILQSDLHLIQFLSRNWGSYSCFFLSYLTFKCSIQETHVWLKITWRWSQSIISAVIFLFWIQSGVFVLKTLESRTGW